MSPGEELAAWRFEHELSQAALGLKIGLSQGAVSRIEAGDQQPMASVAEAIRTLTRGRVTWRGTKNPKRRVKAA